MAWVVELEGVKSQLVYVYSVDAPAAAPERSVQWSAYAQHSALLRNGEVTEHVGPIPLNVEWIEPN
jgi:hypothetical protein